jgi:hypothetical protein
MKLKTFLCSLILIGMTALGFAQQSYPAFFKDNQDKTFIYKENLAFVEGGKGTAKVVEVTNNLVKLSVTSTKRNQVNGQMETKTFDYEIKFKDGLYYRGDQNDPTSYYESGKPETRNNKQVLSLEGEQSAVEFTLE